MTRSVELSYCPDPVASFAAIADRPWAVLLDSGRHDRAHARYDILCADPWATLVTRGASSEIRIRDSVQTSADDPLMLLRALLQIDAHGKCPPPFGGGAIGYFGYDLSRRFEQLPERAIDDEQLPQLAVGIYDWALVTDHRQQRTWLRSAERDAHTASIWLDLIECFRAPLPQSARSPFSTRPALARSMTRGQYIAAFERIKRYIDAGDCYQVNLAQRFEVEAAGDAWTAYRTLRAINPAPHGAYLALPFAHILSASPERFLSLRAGEVQTRPIKGTRPRAAAAEIDVARARELRASEKDRAENLMIVDLLRNDLAKSCRPGSVRVPRLFEIESFAAVHHLVSTVTGTLAEGRDALDLLRGCFPGGSIVGAPKIRAMQIIEELEPVRRGVYCGSIGYIGYDGAMDTNIAIRTLVYKDGRARFWAGGGIVADSNAAGEYQETLDKAQAFFELVRRATAGDLMRGA